MELTSQIITHTALAAGIAFIAWKIYLFTAWNIERAVFLRSVASYLRDKPKTKKRAI